MKKQNKIYLFLLLLVFCSCYRVQDKIEPQLTCDVSAQYLNSLPSAFPPLTATEKNKDWGKELLIATSFAKEMDFYRAITFFKRALILLADEDLFRKQQIEYGIILCYYLGHKIDSVIDTFEKSSLQTVDKSFPTFQDLLIILQDSYRHVKDTKKTAELKQAMEKFFPDSAKKFALNDLVVQADFKHLSSYKIAENTIKSYTQEKKSVLKAQTLNALLPGAGYLYIGQRASATTSFLLNALFIFSTYEFFHKGYTAAGIITAGFEAGWYFGGIYGAGEEAKYYNEHLYEKQADPFMRKEKIFPIFMLQYAF